MRDRWVREEMEDRRVEGTKIMKREMIVRAVPRVKLIMKPRILSPGSSLKTQLLPALTAHSLDLSKIQSARSQTDLQHIVTSGETRN